MKLGLKGKVVVITGASSGIGAAMAREYAADGACVVLGARQQDKLRQIVEEIEQKGGKAAFIDAEHALDPVYAKNLGVKIDELLVSQPSSGSAASMR